MSDDPATAFIETTASFGISGSHVHVDDFKIFGHEGLREAIESFVAADASTDVPLESITVVRYVRRKTVSDDMAGTLCLVREHADAMADFSLRYQVDVNLHLYAQGLDAEVSAEMCALAASGVLDRIGFFFDFADATAESLVELRRALASFRGRAVSRNPKVVVGNFPLCLWPADALKLLYRDAVADLKGHVGAQRGLVSEVSAASFDYHASCSQCRCRRACYTYSEVGAHPECGEWLSPRRERTLVFAGASISDKDVPPDDDIVWVGPAEQGDMVAAVLDGFENILIFDGYFYTKFPCTTLEVMMALEQGVNVFGSSSIGALRAVELEPFGMVGGGYVLEYLKRHAIKPYHVVAQTYDENDRALTTPLIQVLYFLECAEADGVVSREESRQLAELAEGIHFTFLSFDALFFTASARDNIADGVAGKVRDYYSRDPERFDVKRHDAKALLAGFREVLVERPPGYGMRRVEVAQEGAVAMLREKYDRTDDFALPESWRHALPDDTVEGAVSRDSRDCSAEVTCARARAFLEGLGVLLADTTHYDTADSHILSAFFIPFYSLNYYPASATGNGDVFEEALASAYMELVERLSACSLDIRGRLWGEFDQAPFPLGRIPQFYNWGCEGEEKTRAIRERGYVAATNIVSGKREYVPAASIMFSYSGTDGFSAGNSLAEAMLYGLYEVVERDTCQIHLVTPECREFLPRLKIDRDAIQDSRCCRLLAQLDQKGCDIVLFLLPNLYGLPCVMVHVYDRDRGVQCHGGIAVRADFSAATYAALHEATMQYITYFVGTRDDYRAFASEKRAGIAYANARKTFLDGAPGGVTVPGPMTGFGSVADELDCVVSRLTGAGVDHILVADLSPRDEYGVKAVKVIVPGTELWFCPDYVPSPFLAGRAERTVEVVREALG